MTRTLSYINTLFKIGLAAIILTSGPAFAEISKNDAAREIITQGKWVLSSYDTKGNQYWVDPYSIVKIKDDVFQINILGPENDPILGIKQALHLRAQTYQFDCTNRKWAHVGWRYPGGFRSRKVLWGNNSHNLSGGLIADEYFKHVCLYETPEGKFIDAHGTSKIQSQIIKLSVMNNIIYFNSKINAAYVVTQFSGNPKIFTECKTGMSTIEDKDGSLSVNKSDPIYVDWVCKGLHPSSKKVEQDFSIPTLKSQIRNDKILLLKEIDMAKKKCTSLGLRQGTQQFGNCVLKVSE